MLWVRLASHSLGVTTWAVSIVVAIFMAGLGLGGLLLGPRVDASSNPIRFYRNLELLIAVSALIASVVLKRLPNWELGSFSQVLVISLALLIPCTLMGGTLPALGRAVSWMGTTKGLAWLYTANTTGGVLAAFFTDWLFVPLMGVSRTLAMAVFTSALAAALASLAITTQPLAPTEPKGANNRLKSLQLVVLSTYFTTGFVSLGLQIAWTRLVMGMSRPSVYNFSTVLAVFLLGLSLGSAVTANWANKVKNPRAWFGSFLVGISASTLIGLMVIGTADQFLTTWIYRLIESSMFSSALCCALRSVILFGVPTFLMGSAFALAVRLVTDDDDALGTLIGRLSTSNTTGAILGSLLTAFLLVPTLGLFRTFLVLVSFQVLVALFWLRGNFLATKVISTLVLFALLLPNTTLLSSVYLKVWKGSWGLKPDSIRYFTDDSYSTVAVGDTDKGRFLMVNSTRMMGDAPEGLRYASLMGHLPTLLHPDPRSALVICFGCGMTAGALNQQPELENVTCVELSKAVLDAGHLFSETNGGVKNSPKVDFVLGDGRNFLLRTDTKFDVITFEPPPPTQVGVVNLYSYDYYQLCKDRLTEHGIVCQWVPMLLLDEPDLQLVIKAFLEVFPNATLWEGSKDDYLLIGSKDGLKINFSEIKQRMEDPILAEKLAKIGQNRYLEETLTGWAALAYKPEIRDDMSPHLRYWVHSVNGETVKANQTRKEFWNELTSNEKDRLDAATRLSIRG